MDQNFYDYERIRKAIEFIQENFKNQPDLDRVAGKVNLSPFHFQRMFSNWAGISPKQFIQYLSINYAKSLIRRDQKTLFEASLETGFSGPSRLHDLFLKIEGMSPGIYKSGGKSLQIHYSFGISPFGKVILASTEIGLCHLAFFEEEKDGMQTLVNKFPEASFQKKESPIHALALDFFTKDWNNLPELKLHLKGTPFQIQVWEALLRIPMGNLRTYSEIALEAGSPKAQRAIGSAIGENPIAFLIPCHRVIRSTGELGGYHWGLSRKASMIGWEASQFHKSA